MATGIMFTQRPKKAVRDRVRDLNEVSHTKSGEKAFQGDRQASAKAQRWHD